MHDDQATTLPTEPDPGYEPPAIVALGDVHTETLQTG